MSRVRDTDFLHISARIKVLETKLLTGDDINRMATAPSDEDCARIVLDKGYTPFEPGDLNGLEAAFSQEREKLWALLAPYMPNPYIVKTFKIKHDYQNIKAIIKGDALGLNITSLLSSNGTIQSSTLSDMIRDCNSDGLSEAMKAAILDGGEILARTHDPQLSDIRVDRGMYQDMVDMAQRSGSEFLQGYVALLIDSENLRAAVRILRMKKPVEFLKNTLVPGGNVAVNTFLEPDTGESLSNLFKGTPLEQAGNTADSVVSQGTPLAPLDLACDNGLMEYARGARYVSFGDKTVVAYLLAREAEMSQIRTVMIGRAAGSDSMKIQESLRVNYV